MIKKVLFILLEGIISLSILASCKNDYANKMFEIYLNEPDKMISPNANIIPLGQYGTSYVACFHEKHGGDGHIPTLHGYTIGEYWIRIPCPMTWICVYNQKTNELLHISDAYEAGWINDDDLLHIFYEYDQASEQFTGHDWQKSEEFMWDLERDRKKLYYKS